MCQHGLMSWLAGGPCLTSCRLASLPDIHSLWVDVWGVRLRAVQSRCDAKPGNLHLILHPFLDGVLAPAPNFRPWGSGDRSNVDRELIGGSEVYVGGYRRGFWWSDCTRARVPQTPTPTLKPRSLSFPAGEVPCQRLLISKETLAKRAWQFHSSFGPRISNQGNEGPTCRKQLDRDNTTSCHGCRCHSPA